MNGCTILIVEDESIIAADLASKVQRLGYTVVGTTETGEEAVALASQLAPTLVLMDIHLAGPMDGIAAAAAIRQANHVPVVFLTAHSDQGTLERARETEPFGYILKPFTDRDLHVQIEMALYKYAAERRLLESEERLAGIVNTAQDAIISIDEQQRIVLFNPAAEKIFGMPVAEALGAPLERLIPARFHQVHAEYVREFAASSTPTQPLRECIGRRATGEEFPIEVTVSQVTTGGHKIFTVILRDITARKQAEAALKNLNATLEQRVVERTGELRDSEERFRQMAENVEEVFWLADIKTKRILYVSPAYEKIWDRPSGDLYATQWGWLAAVHPDDLARVRAAFHGRVRGAPSEVVYRMVRPDGTIRWIASNAAVVRNPAGRAYRLVGVDRDITASKEASLVRARLAAIVESSTDAISAMDLQGVITDWTASAERLYGYTAAEALGQPISLIVPPDKQDDVALILRKLKRGEGIVGLETERLHKDGHRLAVAISISPVRDETGRIVGSSGIARDITERKRLEAEIQHISEVEKQRLGQDLHDGLIQQLTAVRYLASNLEAGLAEQTLPEAAVAAKLVRALETAVQQTRDITRGLLPVMLEYGKIVPALQELAVSVAGLFQVKCRVVAPRDIHLADTDVARQLYRIAQEALTNAAKHSHGQQIVLRLTQPRGRLVLSVKDDGTGINQKNLNHTGLGLRIMQYRADLLNATLKVARVPGGGTVVTCTCARQKPERKS